MVPGPSRSDAAAALTSFAVVGTIGVLQAVVSPRFSFDAMEHLAIANSWAHGSGFVDPVQWFFLLDGTPPLPGTAVRAPAVSWLAALPLALGASVTGVVVLHAVWAGAVATGALLLARRWMRLPAALAAVSLLFLSATWQLVSRIVWTEVTGVAALLAVLASARGALRSVPGALACAGLTALAGLCRPQLSFLYLAVVVAATWEVGWRTAVRSAPLRAYAVGFPLLWLAVRGLVSVWTGLPLYAAYSATGQFLDDTELMAYGKHYPGRWAFVAAHTAEVVDAIARRSGQLLRTLCINDPYLYAGWLAPLAVLGGLVRRRDGVWEHRILCLCTLGFAAVVLLNYSAFDPKRYPLFVAVPGVLGGLAALDHWLRTRGPGSTWRARARIAWLLPVAALLVFAWTGGATTASQLHLSWTQLRRDGPARMARSNLGNAREIRAICRRVDPDSHVAVSYPLPWAFTFWCGNATTILPTDIGEPGVLERFLRERRPRYLVVWRTRPMRRLGRLPWLRLLGSTAKLSLYEVVDGRSLPSVWKAPPPVACAGEGAGCGLQPGDVAVWLPPAPGLRRRGAAPPHSPR